MNPLVLFLHQLAMMLFRLDRLELSGNVGHLPSLAVQDRLAELGLLRQFCLLNPIHWWCLVR